MAHTPKTTLYTVERRERSNPKDKKRIIGLPSVIEARVGFLDKSMFVTSNLELAKSYRDEMLDLWGKTCDYVVIAKGVRV
jgi:hypothetical protein